MPLQLLRLANYAWPITIWWLSPPLFQERDAFSDLRSRGGVRPPLSCRTAPNRDAPNRAAPNRTAPNRTAPNRTDRTAPNRTAPNRTALNRTDRTATNRTAPNRSDRTAPNRTDHTAHDWQDDWQDNATPSSMPRLRQGGDNHRSGHWLSLVALVWLPVPATEHRAVIINYCTVQLLLATEHRDCIVNNRSH